MDQHRQLILNRMASAYELNSFNVEIKSLRAALPDEIFTVDFAS
jgi:hypothetical protein